MKKLLAAIALAGTIFAAPAWADDFDFTYTYNLARANDITVIGRLTGSLITGTSSYQITGITGTRMSTLGVMPFAITGLAAAGSIGGNDNILTLFAPRDAGAANFYVPSANGIAFTETPGPSPVRLFSTAANQRLDMAQENFGTTTSSSFLISITPTAVTGAVPEPATWGMMILGMGAVGFAMRRRQKVAAKVSFAA